jgi:Leucine-rich repeat (LRR) protein
MYDYEWGSGSAGRAPHAPRWLRRLIGDEYFRDVVSVSLAGDSQGNRDDVLAALDGFSRLKVLRLGSRQATDEVLEHIKGLAHLEELYVDQPSEVTDAGVAHLERLTKLKDLYISRSQMTDVGLSHLKGLTRLERLAIQCNSISDRGLAHLQGLEKLQELYLGLSNREITDEGLADLEGLKDLEVLDLQCSQVTNRGLEHLKGLPKLREVRYGGSRVTDEGFKKLQEETPSLKTMR